MKIDLPTFVSNRYLTVAKVVEKYIDTIVPTISPEKLDVYKSKVLTTNPLAIDYNQYFFEFAQLYWLTNFWKGVYMFEYEMAKQAIRYRPGKKLKITSLGAGSASDVVACMVWLSLNPDFRGETVEITLIDKSAHQLLLAEKIITLILSYVSEVHFELKYQVLEIENWSPQKDDQDIVLMGHFLIANVGTLATILKKAVHISAMDGHILIMERERDEVWKKAVLELADLGLSPYSADLDKSKFHILQASVPAAGLDERITPHYVVSKIPHKKQLGLVTKYFQSWRFQTPDLLEEIFVDRVVYAEKPGLEPPITSLRQVYDYWKHNPMNQKNINLWIRDVAYSDYNIVCAFEGDFDTPKQHINIRGALSFLVDPYVQKVRRFEAYFGTNKTLFGAT